MPPEPTSPVTRRGKAAERPDQPLQPIEEAINTLLERIASDPESGAWGEWARKLLEADQTEVPATRKLVRPRPWRPPRKPR